MQYLSKDPDRDKNSTAGAAYSGVSADDEKNWFVQRFMWSAHKDTIDVLYLNDTEGLVLPRFRIGNTVQQKLIEVKDQLSNYQEHHTTQRKNRIVNTIRDLLKETKETSEYSALVASVLMQDDIYNSIRDEMKDNKLWDEEMETMHVNTSKIALIK